MKGRVSAETHALAVRLRRENLDTLWAHQPSLVHASAFPWTIYLRRENGGWRITKLTALGDVLWWDPAVDLAMMRYPPFGETTPEQWEAFLEAYGAEPEPRRLHLYAVLGRLCAGMGAYMQPDRPGNAAWAKRCLKDVDRFLDVVERG